MGAGEGFPGRLKRLLADHPTPLTPHPLFPQATAWSRRNLPTNHRDSTKKLDVSISWGSSFAPRKRSEGSSTDFL